MFICLHAGQHQTRDSGQSQAVGDKGHHVRLAKAGHRGSVRWEAAGGTPVWPLADGSCVRARPVIGVVSPHQQLELE